MLEDQAILYALLCEKLERLQIMSEDPRLNRGNNTVHQTVLQLVDTFFNAIKISQATNPDNKVKNLLTSEQTIECFSKINGMGVMDP